MLFIVYICCLLKWFIIVFINRKKINVGNVIIICVIVV